MKLLHYPNDSLNFVCKDVTKFDQELHFWLDQMKQIMVANNGMGLAANQIGLESRIFVMKDLKDKLWEFINPVILSAYDSQYENEGCLSFPGVTVQVRRPKQITIKAYDRNGEEFTIVAIDKEAVCISHEIDHLQGNTFLNRLSRQQRRDILRGLKK